VGPLARGAEEMLSRTKIVIGSRGSALALQQARWVRNELQASHPQLAFELKIIKTTGDKILDVPLARIGDKGLFTKEIEAALIRGEIDLAIHSLKDLPTDVPAELELGAVTKRENAHDVLISREGLTLKKLPSGACVGTSSLRRVAQLKHCRPDFELVSLRGNLDTRLRKLEEQSLDGIVVAAAGVIRLGLTDRITEEIPFSVSLPAVGQGALGIEVRKDNLDPVVSELVSTLNDEATYRVCLAERSFLRALGGGCQVPIGAYGVVDGQAVSLQGVVASLDGEKLLRGSVSGPIEESEALGEKLAKELLEQGAGEIMSSIKEG